MVKEFNKSHQLGIEPIYSDKGAAENLNLVATGRADAAGEYEYVVNVARKEQGLPVQAVGSVMQSGTHLLPAPEGSQNAGSG